ncbi:MBL fold metallo-hydrolase [Insolitispirillum peregrinum]|uniref:Phosphoribosyl 1,2-cyclic phosphodiesterase n=1 Tax=Insolitispirillum peregrinum TaxID=80876 RepID=A0A1N7IIY2_9PROT|nr:MBL fold metallo-hydrolase [Insolitispirillum peregrinum]SIS36956.1 Phosphoribosyl 1,2-cyclic phosphodiesterase [Insolitispirillum peregrinum]
MSLHVKFWGVRGSIACPSPNHVVYGGNTSCVQVTLDDHTIIFDAGTGIRGLGHEILRRDIRRSSLMLTHTHWDHINGFPFFAPAFQANRHFRIYAGHLQEMGGIYHVLANQMANPTFPVPLDALQATLEFIDFTQGETLEPEPGVLVRTAPLRHPNGATGYRIDYKGASVCYVTDTEHIPGQPDQTILDLIAGADLVIYDSTYTDSEFPAKVGWGHSTWQEGVRLCRQADAKRLAIFHHDPDHDDQFMERLEEEARTLWSGALVARDNLELTLA